MCAIHGYCWQDEKLIGEIVSSTLGYITKDNDNIVEDEEVKKANNY